MRRYFSHEISSQLLSIQDTLDIVFAAGICWVERGRGRICPFLRPCKDKRKNQQRSQCRSSQTTNHSSTQWSALLRSFSECKRHGDHAGDHCDTCHQNWAQAARASIKGCFDGICTGASMFFSKG